MSVYSIAAMLRKLMCVPICLDRSLLRWAIWLWMYSRKVREVHLPAFMIVVSVAP